MILGPTLGTARLTLRPLQESDFDTLRAFGRSEERMRFLGGVVDAHAQWRTLLADIGHGALRGYGLFSIQVADTGRLVGRAGPILHHRNEDLELA
jgi:RimJ/RimL family protein N-acetyltransferase